MRRREFILLLGGAVAAWPVGARAQQPGQMRRIGVLLPYAADDAVGQTRYAVFVQGLQQLGWTIGHNAQIEVRWATANVAAIRRQSAELVALGPDVILVSGTQAAGLLLQVAHTVPVVFVQVTDPVGAGYVNSLAHPGTNATGFAPIEYGMGAKWLELLKEITPGLTRAAVLRDPTMSGGIGVFGAIQSVGPSFGVEISPINLRDPDEIERAVTAFARASNVGLIVPGSPSARVHINLIITLAARHKLPAVYWDRAYVASGALISYAPDLVDQWRRAAGYVDRILKGEKPSDLPVQEPTKFETVINLKTAKSLGLTVPRALLVRADEVIE